MATTDTGMALVPTLRELRIEEKQFPNIQKLIVRYMIWPRMSWPK